MTFHCFSKSTVLFDSPSRKIEDSDWQVTQTKVLVVRNLARHWSLHQSSVFFDLSIALPSYRNASHFPWKKDAILAFSQAALCRTFQHLLRQMGLVGIRHLVAQHASWSSAHAHTTPARKALGGRRTGWKFLPFVDTENQFLSTFDSPFFRTHNKSHNLKTNACSWPRLQPGSRWWCKSLQMPQARMGKLRKEGSPDRFIAL